MQARVLAAEAGPSVVATFIPHYAGGTVMAPLVELTVNAPRPGPDRSRSPPRGEGPQSADALANWPRRLTSACGPTARRLTPAPKWNTSWPNDERMRE